MREGESVEKRKKAPQQPSRKGTSGFIFSKKFDSIYARMKQALYPYILSLSLSLSLSLRFCAAPNPGIIRERKKKKKRNEIAEANGSE